MLKISDALNEIVKQNRFLKFGLSKRLLNLSQLSIFLKPLLEAKTKKSIKPQAITMSLSRLQKTLSKIAPKITKLPIENLTIHSNLATLTYFKSADVHRKINMLHSKLRNTNSFITITEGTSEITLIIDQEALKTAKMLIKEKPKNEEKDLTALGVKFSEKSIEIHGLLNQITQLLAFQYINIVEITSTYTEFVVYINKKDTNLAFDTLMANT